MERFTKHCYELSVLKSGLQRSIRLGNVKQALQCGLEIHVSEDSRELWNILFTCAVEDVGMGCINAVQRLLQLYRESEKDALISVTQAIVFLCRCKKSRTLEYAQIVGCWQKSSGYGTGIPLPTDLPKIKDRKEDVGKVLLDYEKILGWFYHSMLLSVDIKHIYYHTIIAFQLHEREHRLVDNGVNPFLKLKFSEEICALCPHIFSSEPIEFHKSSLSSLWWLILRQSRRRGSEIFSIVAALAEVTALKLGSDCLNLLMAVTLCFYHKGNKLDNSGLQHWSLSRILTSTSLTEERIENFLSTRPITVPDEWVDLKTYRGRGVDTLPQFKKWAAEKGIDLSKWKEADYMNKCCLPKKKGQDFHEFLSSIKLENKFRVFGFRVYDEIETEAKKLYAQKEEECAVLTAREHRDWIYKNEWSIAYGKLVTKKRKRENDEDEFKYHAQKRTSRHKKHTYITPEYVFKGPYERDSKKLHTVVARHRFLGGPLNDTTVQPFEQVERKDGIYLRFRNISRVPFSEWIIEDVTTLKDKEHVKIPTRQSLGIQQVTGCLDSLTEIQKKRVIYHLLLRFCCSPAIGDTHLGNMLYNGTSVFGVDLEDNRKHSEIGEPRNYKEFVQMLFTKCGKNSDYVNTLAATLTLHVNDFIISLKRASAVAVGAAQYVKQKSPNCDLDGVATKRRMDKCIQLLEQLASH